MEVFFESRHTLNAYLRLFFADLVPGTGKVLYLDCDLIISKSFRELYEIELGDNILAAARDVWRFLKMDRSGLTSESSMRIT